MKSKPFELNDHQLICLFDVDIFMVVQGRILEMQLAGS